MEQTNNIQLHDIKTIVEVEEYSRYYLMGISIVVIFLLIAIIYLLIKWYRNKNRYNQRKDYLKILKSLDLNDTKKTAYAITFHGTLFKDDSPRHTEMFKNITQRLEPYKYKKVVNKLDKETLGYIELYKEMLDA
ncbi:MAG: hypothetical protein U9N02_06925 [Campylobacterota bacterium]|nr:hypothetical protein [Campylobacterota bacterium]